jgi:hypothetical protein
LILLDSVISTNDANKRSGRHMDSQGAYKSTHSSAS